MTAAGEVLDPEGIPIATTSSREARPVVTFDGTHYLVAWHLDTGGIRAARVSPAGAVLDPSPLNISPDGWNAAVTNGGGSSLVVWNNSGIIARRVGTDGTLLDPEAVTISSTAHPEAEPAIVFNGTNHLVVWDDDRSDAWGDIFAARISPAGAVLDPSGVAIAANSSQSGLAQREPTVAANGTSFFVVWRDDRRRGVTADGADIFGARVDGNGVLLDPSGISITNSAAYESEPVVARSVGNTWRVAYRRFAADRAYGADRVFHKTISPG